MEIPIGVYVGDTGSDFMPIDAMLNPDLIATGQHMNSRAWSGAQVSTTCSRLSHCLGLTGPTSSVDTACSAGLVATSIATSSIRKVLPAQGRVHLGTHPTEALACGVSVQVGPYSFIALCSGTMLSPKGRCHTYNDTADGYARGEGIVSVPREFPGYPNR